MFSSKKDFLGTLLGALALVIPFLLIVMVTSITKITIIKISMWITFFICQFLYLTALRILFYDRDKTIKKLKSELESK